MRVRQAAQFALAEKGSASIPAFAGVAREGKRNRLARFHAIWGLGQIGRKDATAYKEILPLLKDADSEVRAQAAKALGEGKVAEAGDSFIAPAEGRGAARAFLRGAGLGPRRRQEGRAGRAGHAPRQRRQGRLICGTPASWPWSAAAPRTPGWRRRTTPSPAVRMGVLLALRRTDDPDVARFLNDADPLLVVEAARAINDVPIDAAMPKLAALVRRPGCPTAAGLSASSTPTSAWATRRTPRPWRRSRPGRRFGDVADRGAEGTGRLDEAVGPRPRDGRVAAAWSRVRRSAPPTPSGRAGRHLQRTRQGAPGGRRDGGEARRQGGRPRAGGDGRPTASGRPGRAWRRCGRWGAEGFPPGRGGEGGAGRRRTVDAGRGPAAAGREGPGRGAAAAGEGRRFRRNRSSGRRPTPCWAI